MIPLIWITEEVKEYNVEYRSILILNKNYLKEMNGVKYALLNKRK